MCAKQERSLRVWKVGDGEKLARRRAILMYWGVRKRGLVSGEDDRGGPADVQAPAVSQLGVVARTEAARPMDR